MSIKGSMLMAYGMAMMIEQPLDSYAEFTGPGIHIDSKQIHTFKKSNDPKSVKARKKRKKKNRLKTKNKRRK